MTRGLDNNAHSVFSLYYHLVLVTKYRRKVINDEISQRLREMFDKICRLIKKEFPEIRSKLWDEYFWNQSFCLLSTGCVPIEIIRTYIEEQGNKN